MQTDNKPLLRDLDADWRTRHPDWSGEWYTIEQVEQDAMFLEARRDQRERESKTDNRPLIQAFDADFRNTHPGGHWYNIDVETCESDASLFETRRDQREREEICVVQDRAGLAAKIVEGWLAAWQGAEV